MYLWLIYWCPYLNLESSHSRPDLYPSLPWPTLRPPPPWRAVLGPAFVTALHALLATPTLLWSHPPPPAAQHLLRAPGLTVHCSLIIHPICSGGARNSVSLKPNLSSLPLLPQSLHPVLKPWSHVGFFCMHPLVALAPSLPSGCSGNFSIGLFSQGSSGHDCTFSSLS